MAAAGRLAFVSTHPDQNLWSVEVDASSGVTRGPLRRLTRGPGILGHLTVSNDGRTLSYWTTPTLVGNLWLLGSREERGHPVCRRTRERRPGISGTLAQWPAVGVWREGDRRRPARDAADLRGHVADRVTRKLGDDCGGRPRQWLDERLLLIEAFGSRLNTFAVLDTTDGSRRELVSSAERSATNPRLSPDRRWIAFDATRPGGSPNVYVAPLGEDSAIVEGDWVEVDRDASHPFWSADGRFLYYLPTTPTRELRSVVRARRVGGESGLPEGEAFVAFASNEMIVPAIVSGTAPVATADRIFLVLGDFRGDVWMMDLGRLSFRA